jgi:hypothetical protein
LRISTVIDTATAAEPALSASAPAMFVIVVSSSAETSIDWFALCVTWLTCAKSPMYAFVSSRMTSTMTEPVTAALPPPALPPTATEETAGRASSSFSERPVSGWIGSSVAFDVTEIFFAASTCVTSPPEPESM